jgi:hypothetical protein
MLVLTCPEGYSIREANQNQVFRLFAARWGLIFQESVARNQPLPEEFSFEVDPRFFSVGETATGRNVLPPN